jgi:hypothetical protein
VTREVIEDGLHELAYPFALTAYDDALRVLENLDGVAEPEVLRRIGKMTGFLRISRPEILCHRASGSDRKL